MPLTPILADVDLVVGLIIGLITVVGWIANLASNKNQKGPPIANRPRPPVRPREEKLQQEINIFLEDAAAPPRRETGGRPAAPVRTGSVGSPQGGTAFAGRATAGRPTASRPAANPQGRGPAQSSGQGRKSGGGAAGKSSRKPRPGESIAGRPAPLTESLGAGVKQSLSQHMSDRVSQEVQQRLASRVEEKVSADLGTTMTSGASMRAPALPAAVSTTLRADRFAELLRNPANVRQAIVLNLILSPPPGRAGTSRR